MFENRRRRRALLAAAPCLLLAAATTAPAMTAAPKTTVFAGSISSGTGSYVHARGAVRLVLRGTTTATGHTFKLTLSGPSCATETFHAPSHCISLTGAVSGKVGQAPVIPDIGTSYALAGSGRVSPLGAVRASGTTHGIGFIAHGRFPLVLTLRNAHGSVMIRAQGPVSPGFSSPF